MSTDWKANNLNEQHFCDALHFITETV